MYIFILYGWDINEILSDSMKNHTYGEIIKFCNKLYKSLTNPGFKPYLYFLENDIPEDLKDKIT